MNATTRGCGRKDTRRAPPIRSDDATEFGAAISGELTMVAEWIKRIAADEMRNKEEKEVSGNSTRNAIDNASNSRTIGGRPAFRQQASFGPVKWLKIGKIREIQSRGHRFWNKFAVFSIDKQRGFGYFFREIIFTSVK
jgi:hypothetical protein